MSAGSSESGPSVRLASIQSGLDDAEANPSLSAADVAPIEDGRLTEFADDAVACMRRLHSKHGDLSVLRQDGQQIVLAIGPEWNQRILSDATTFHSRFFAVRGSRRSAQRRVTSGLLSMNGARHRQHRRMVMGPFQKRAIDGYLPYIIRLADEMLDQWQPGQVIDVNSEMTEFMLSLTSAILFGVDLPELASDLGVKVDRWTRMNHETGMGAFVSDPVFVERYERLLALAEDLESGVLALIERRRKTGKLGHDVLSLLLRAREETGELTDEELVGHVTLTFGAAHLTTAHTLTWTLFLLAQHPELLLRLEEETHSDPASSAGSRLLDSVLKESMRVLPASAYSQRINAVPVSFGPLQLSPGTPIIFSQFMTHHLERLYDHPDEFRPERWESIAPGAYEFLPFGAGPRMCVGGSLAMLILKSVLPRVLSRFRLSLLADSEVSARVISTMLGPTTPVLMEVSVPQGTPSRRPVSGNIHELVSLHPDCVASSGSGRTAA